MEEYKDYFKSRKEVEGFFGNEPFKFSYMCDNIMYFQTLNPVFLGQKLVNFELGFYFEQGCDFFAYSKFNTWLEKHQLSSVTSKCEESQDQTQMFFRKYVDYKNN